MAQPCGFCQPGVLRFDLEGEVNRQRLKYEQSCRMVCCPSSSAGGQKGFTFR